MFRKSHGLVHSNSQDSDGESDSKRTVSQNEGSVEPSYTPGVRRKQVVSIRKFILKK